MKKLTALDNKLVGMTDDEHDDKDMLTFRQVLRLVGNVKAETADNSRRTRRIITKLRDKTMTDLVLENDDVNFLLTTFEKNSVGLTAWAQGQLLDWIEAAEKVEEQKV